MKLSPYFRPEIAATSVTARAFDSLSGVHRSLLWYLDVEKLPLSQVGEIMGLDSGSIVAQIAQARFDLRSAWVVEQASSPKTPLLCAAITKELARGAIRLLSQAQRDEIQEHLTYCIRCAILAEELDHLHEHLPVAMLPLVVGPPSIEA